MPRWAGWIWRSPNKWVCRHTSTSCCWWSGWGYSVAPHGGFQPPPVASTGQYSCRKPSSVPVALGRDYMHDTRLVDTLRSSGLMRLFGWLTAVAAAVIALSLDSGPTFAQAAPMQPATNIATPIVQLINPAFGEPSGSTEVTIQATNIDQVTAVNFGGSAARIQSVTHPSPLTTVIDAVSPPGTGVVDVTVTGPAGTSPPTPSDRFSYAPQIASISPPAGPSGIEVVIHGSGLVTIKGVSLVTAVAFGAIPATRFRVDAHCTATDPTPCIKAIAPSGTDVVDVTLTGPGGTSDVTENDEFSYAPQIISISPPAGPSGTEVVIHGSGLVTRKGVSLVTAVAFGAIPATHFRVDAHCTANDPTPCIKAIAPSGTDVVDVTLTGPGGTSDVTENDEFSYAPQIASISPPAGPSGTEVVIHGSGLVTRKGVSLVTAVDFGATPATRFRVDAHCTLTDPAPCIKAIAPSGTDVVDVTLTGPGGTSDVTENDEFSYAPQIISISPPAGPSGTEVVIHGSGLVTRKGV